MGRHQRVRTLLCMGAVLALFAALVAGPDTQGMAQAERTRARPSADGSGCDCAKADGMCCSAPGDGCCCATKTLTRGTPVGPSLVTLLQEGAKQEKKAGPEAMAKGETARKAIEEHRRALAKDGVHSCCIRPACTFCQAAEDMCPCAKSLAKGDPVCPECWGGWQAGHGRLEGIDPKKVKVLGADKLKTIYDAKAKKFEKAAGGADKK